MRKFIRRSLHILFGQMRNVFGRQKDFTIKNAKFLLMTLQCVFWEIHHHFLEKKILEGYETRLLIKDFVSALLYELNDFLIEAKFGRWIIGLDPLGRNTFSYYYANSWNFTLFMVALFIFCGYW